MQIREVRLLTTGVAHDYIGHRGKSLSTNNSEIFLRVASEVPDGAETMALAGAVTGHQPHDRLLCRGCSYASPQCAEAEAFGWYRSSMANTPG
jgi:hypothetical protein